VFGLRERRREIEIKIKKSCSDAMGLTDKIK